MTRAGIMWAVAAKMHPAATLQEIMSDAGWTPGGFADALTGGVSPADALHDPATYVMGSVAVGGIVKAAGATLFGVVGAGYQSVNTPYGQAYQSTTQQALQAREQVQNGASLYKMGTLGPSNGIESQFWSLQNPLHISIQMLRNWIRHIKKRAGRLTNKPACG